MLGIKAEKTRAGLVRAFCFGGNRAVCRRLDNSCTCWAVAVNKENLRCWREETQLVNSVFADTASKIAGMAVKIEKLSADLREAIERAKKLHAAVDARTKQR